MNWIEFACASGDAEHRARWEIPDAASLKGSLGAVPNLEGIKCSLSCYVVCAPIIILVSRCCYLLLKLDRHGKTGSALLLYSFLLKDQEV